MLYQYNDILMQMVKTNNIQFEAVFTEDQAVYLYTHYIIDIQAVVNPKTMSYTGGAGDGDPAVVPGTFPATTIRAIRHALMQPRKILSIFDEANNILLETPELGFATDAKVGPIPISCQIINISGARTLMLRWQCEGWIHECPSSESPYILSNRWTDQMSINEYQLTTRVFVGRTVFNRALMDDSNFIPDNFRNSIFPNVAMGYQRKTVNITQNAEGTELLWRVEDREQMWTLTDTTPEINGISPPAQIQGEFGSGILEIDGVQAIIGFKPKESQLALIGNTLNHIQLRAKGSFYANQWLMIQRLIQIAGSFTPLLMAEGDINAGYHCMDAQITRSLGQHEKWVELKLVIMCPNTDTVNPKTANLNLNPIANDIWHAINTVIDQNSGTSPPLINDFGSRGSSTITLLTNVLTDSCQLQPEMPTVDITYNEGQKDPNNESDDKLPPAYDRPIIPEERSGYDTSGSYRTITGYNINVDYKTNSGIKQIPITGPPPSTDYVPGGGPAASTCGLVQLHLPVTRVEFEGTAERIGGFPLLPLPASTNDDEYVLLSWYLSPFYPVPSYDGVTPVYRCDFRYVYAMRLALDPANPMIKVGKLPFSLFGNEESNEVNFSKDIIKV